MPRCEGRPDGPCPLKKNDKTVHLSQGDLMLCSACENFRFPAPIAGKATRTHPATAVTESQPTERIHDKSLGGGDLIIVNELLSYSAYYRNRANGETMRRVILTSFSGNDIREAKDILGDKFRAAIGDSSLLTDRRDSNIRPAHEAELDDIIGLLDLLDERGRLQGALFVAADLERLPKFGPEELNVGAVVDRQLKLDNVIGKLSIEIEQLKAALTADSMHLTVNNNSVFESAMSELQKRIDAFHASIDSRVDYLNSVCMRLSASVCSGPNLTNRPSAAHEDADRSLNIIIFGIAESREISEWRSKVDNVLKFVVGRDVDVSDAFRLGQFNSSKVRPVLVKLRSVWDKRLILRSSWKLKSYPERVFVGPDEPLEVRRKQTFERLKYRAGRDGKSVNVVDDILYIDSIATFSVKDGFLHSHNA